MLGRSPRGLELSATKNGAYGLLASTTILVLVLSMNDPESWTYGPATSIGFGWCGMVMLSLWRCNPSPRSSPKECTSESVLARATLRLEEPANAAIELKRLFSSFDLYPNPASPSSGLSVFIAFATRDRTDR